ncbi:hypothetical protein BGZ98_005341, partial [Dissophora globulifera]
MKDGTISEFGHFDTLVAARQGFYELNLEFSTANKRRKHARNSQSDQQQDGVDSDSDSSNDAETQTVVSAESQSKKGGSNNVATLVEAEKMVKGSVGWNMFLVWAKAASYNNIAAIFVLYVFVQAAKVSTNFWLRYWSDTASQNKYTVTQFLVIYGALTLAFMSFNMVLFYVSNVKTSLKAARRLHDRLLSSLLRQPMSFFDTTPVGRIINRFSSDVDAIDEMIIWNFVDVVYALVAIGATFVVISTSTPLFLVVVPPIALAYLHIHIYFISSSQPLKRFMSVSKSPLYQHFGETLAGASTIRAMAATPRFIDMNSQKADLAAETTLAFGISGRWLKMRLEFLGALIVFAAALLAVLNYGHLSASAVGLSLTYAISITADITCLFRAWSEMTNRLISVERIDEFSKLKPEAPEETGVRLPENWPSRGNITFKDYSTRYREGLDLVLNHVSFNVQSGEK